MHRDLSSFGILPDTLKWVDRVSEWWLVAPGTGTDRLAAGESTIHVLNGLTPITGQTVKVKTMTSRERFQLNVGSNQAGGFQSFTFVKNSYDRSKRVRHAKKSALDPEDLEPETSCTEYKSHIQRTL
jgi:hypothetical protein